MHSTFIVKHLYCYESFTPAFLCFCVFVFWFGFILVWFDLVRFRIFCLVLFWFSQHFGFKLLSKGIKF